MTRARRIRRRTVIAPWPVTYGERVEIGTVKGIAVRHPSAGDARACDEGDQLVIQTDGGIMAADGWVELRKGEIMAYS
jgi:hypothetical protein